MGTNLAVGVPRKAVCGPRRQQWSETATTRQVVTTG